MSLKSGVIKYPPKAYKSPNQLSPEDEKVDIESLFVIHKKVHTSVEGSKIVEFFNGKCVFLTGGTGFIGKLLTEKLLRTCKGMKTIYLIVRTKKGKDVESRLDKTFEDPLFSELRKVQPNFRNRVVLIAGDIALPDLGISIQDRQKLVENVNVIIHSAATVRFDEPLRQAAATNVSGTKGVMTLAQQCKNIVSVVHISTAFCQCVYKEIREELYDPVYMTEHFLKTIEGNNDQYLNDNRKAILRGWPNTYSFTKAIAEHTVQSMANDIPTAICRPGVVTSTYKEPLKGWIDNMYGPMGAIVGAATGVVRTLNIDPDKMADVIPGDFVANGVIAAAYQNQFNEKGVVKVYNNIATSENPITWIDFTRLTTQYGLQNPPLRAMWYQCATLNKHRYVHFLYQFFLHSIPALLMDGCLGLTGRKMKMVKMYKTVNKFCLIVGYFGVREWKMRNENVQNLWNSLTDKDKELFEFSMAPSNFNWNSYTSTLWVGVRTYLLKEKMDSVAAARIRYNRFYYLHNALKTVALLIALRVAVAILSSIISIFSS